jgi:hypothetical protein
MSLNVITCLRVIKCLSYINSYCNSIETYRKRAELSQLSREVGSYLLHFLLRNHQDFRGDGVGSLSQLFQQLQLIHCGSIALSKKDNW